LDCHKKIKSLVTEKKSSALLRVARPGSTLSHTRGRGKWKRIEEILRLQKVGGEEIRDRGRYHRTWRPHHEEGGRQLARGWACEERKPR